MFNQKLEILSNPNPNRGLRGLISQDPLLLYYTVEGNALGHVGFDHRPDLWEEEPPTRWLAHEGNTPCSSGHEDVVLQHALIDGRRTHRLKTVAPTLPCRSLGARASPLQKMPLTSSPAHEGVSHRTGSCLTHSGSSHRRTRGSKRNKWARVFCHFNIFVWGTTNVNHPSWLDGPDRVGHLNQAIAAARGPMVHAGSERGLKGWAEISIFQCAKENFGPRGLWT
jgi:hypothetical protein